MPRGGDISRKQRLKRMSTEQHGRRSVRCLVAAAMMAFMFAVAAAPFAPMAAQPNPPAAPPAPPPPGTAPAVVIGTAPACSSEKCLRQKRTIEVVIVSVSLAVLVAVATALIIRIWRLGDKLARLSQTDDNARKTYLQMALGVQDGTIRSALAILIVVGALLALIAALGGTDLGLQVPDALTGVFGTILGFYFGRAGTVETSRTVDTLTAAATVAANAQTGLHAAQQAASTAQKEAADAKQALNSSQAAQVGDLGTAADELLTASMAIVAGAPPSVASALQPALTAAKAGIETAKKSPDPALLRQAIIDLQTKGPLAQLIQSATSAFTPFGAGLSPIQAASQLLDIGAKLPPVMCQLWTARLLRAPYSQDLFVPVVNADYAKTLIGRVPGASDLQSKLSSIDPTITPIEFVRDLLNEDAAEMLEDRSGEKLTAAAIGGVIDQVQQSAVEIELEKALPADTLKPFGGTAVFFAALNRVQANPNGQALLDFLALAQKAARSAGLAPTDLLSQ